jgi:hypothetical protein
MDEFYLCWNWTQVILCLDLLMLLTENFVKFCMKEVFKCRERRMMRWDEEWTKAQAWGCPCHPKTYSRSTSVKAWGCPRHPLLHQQKYQVLFQYTIFLLLHMLCVVLGASLFLFLVYFSLVCYSSWLDHSSFVLERNTLCFHCLEHSSFILITLRVFSCC